MKMPIKITKFNPIIDRASSKIQMLITFEQKNQFTHFFFTAYIFENYNFVIEFFVKTTKFNPISDRASSKIQMLITFERKKQFTHLFF